MNARYPYRLLYQKDGIYSAYYFSVPIYNRTADTLVSPHFSEKEGGAEFLGSNAKITLGEDILMENPKGKCRISMPSGYRYESDELISYDGIELYPTLNGVACIAKAEEKRKHTFRISTDAPLSHVSGNQKCFCTMLSAIEPHLSISCIGSLDKERELISPAYIQYRRIEADEFEVSVCTDSPNAEYLFFEMNLHTPKLFLDTTVETRYPDKNNAFGTVAFIGETQEFGEERLFCRPLLMSLGGLRDADIESAAMYIPKLDGGSSLLAAHRLTARFCSFASNWNNQKPSAYKYVSSEIKNGYHRIDVTNIIIKNREISKYAEGWMLRVSPERKGLCVISTADSFFAPQILEITFRKNLLNNY